MSKPFQHWDDALVAAGLVDPRNGNPSRNQLARRVGMSAGALNAVMDNRSTPRAATIQKIADALGLDVRIVSGWVGQKRTERGPYTPPAEADLLTDRQRKAVDEIIRAIVAERAGTDDGRDDEQDGERGPRRGGPAPAAGSSGVAGDAERDGVTPLRGRRPAADEGDDDAAEIPRAAHKGVSQRARMDAEAARRGEESQDPEDWQ